MIEDKKKLQNTVKELLEGKFPGFEKEWNKFSKSIGEKFVETITEYFTDGNYFMSQLLPHSLSVVIDNNFIFGQIKTMVRDKKPLQDSFIYKLCELSFIEINAPYKLQEELKAKIDLLIDENKEMALEYADKLLELITIKDAQWTNEWKKANNLIGGTDIDDVPYLALAFQERSHGIISYDKVFQKQGEVQT